MAFIRRPGKYGLYDPAFEHDSCGVGFVAQINGEASHTVVDYAKEVLLNMTHRGAVGAEKNTGDGAGVLTAIPWDFLETAAPESLGMSLPERGRYSAGLVFLPQNVSQRERCRERFAAVVAEKRQRLLGWRRVPTDNGTVGPSARSCEPVVEQVFIAASPELSQEEFERKLYLIRKRATREIRGSRDDGDHFFYICSLSTRVLVYKGMLMPDQLFAYYPDLSDPAYTTHLAMVHSRFSTNTFPSWDRAQPLRFMSHNGEINTLRGNINKMRAREGLLASPYFGDEISELFPIVEPDLSDSGNFDNVLELLLMAGRSLPEAVMMMVPEAWENHQLMDADKRAFYEYHSCLMEPWDGPASVAFTDGTYIGAVLDRNGLRPSRYYVTDDDFVIMASEVGVLDLPPERVRTKGRLQPGRMFLVNFDEGRIVDDEELKRDLAAKRPYRTWLNRRRIELEELPLNRDAHGFYPETLPERLRLFGYTVEHVNLILEPMAKSRKEPLGSMGNDTPLACLSDKPKILYDYFKQLFAQVTNPPIDSIREENIMSLESFIGPEKNLLETTEAHCHRLHVPMPILTNEQLAALKHMDHRGWRSKVVDITFPRTDGEAGLVACLDRISAEVEAAIGEGYSLVILSDRAADTERLPAGALLACGAVHHHLTRKALRTQIGLVLETGEPREVHHFCLLTGYGADAVNPYLAIEVMWQLQRDGILAPTLRDDEIVIRFRDAIAKGMRKVFGKMGISTLSSYRGAQIFEAVGLSAEVVDRCFAGTSTRIQGATFETLAAEAIRRHNLAFPRGNVTIGTDILNHGEYQWRAGGERHMWDPESIADLQVAARTNDRVAYLRFAERQNARSAHQATLRGLLTFVEREAVPIEEVEPVEAILRRFATGAMSFGSISKEAHETLAVAMNRIGGKSNTGEGGEDPERAHTLPNGDSKRSAIKQIASGRFGANANYLTSADEIQIKMAQGAKPGEGGELPGHKVNEIIARIRHSTPGVGLISPPPHHDIYSIEDLAELIYDLKNANPQARISVKLVSEIGVGTVAAGVTKGHADHILISGHDGGTGASPLTGINHAGLPWELGLAETHQTLVMNDLRSRVTLQTDGQLKTGRDCAIACLLGAEEFGFATGALITLGCVMMRKCEKNTCPVGVATQDPRLRKKFTGRPEYVVNYLTFVAHELREIMARLGFRTINEMVGRTDALRVDETIRHWKAQGLDLSPILVATRKPHPEVRTYCCISQDHGIDDVLDRRLINLAEPALSGTGTVYEELAVRNTDRAVGATLSHVIAQRTGEAGLPDGAVHFRMHGSAGQSFGAWLASGVTLELEGDANDYVGKGLSGGRIIVYPPTGAGFLPEDNIVVGNVALYGAVEGQAFFRGRAAERFCVRNSGAHVVVEGVGDHGCEYMTGGRTVVLGDTGRNFAAGMSGGIAYVLDVHRQFDRKCNLQMVELEQMDDEDEALVKELVRLHLHYTGSTVAEAVLDRWGQSVASFRKVMPRDLKRVLEARKRQVREVAHG